MSIAIDSNAVQRIKATAQIAAAQMRPQRNRISVHTLELTDTGITAKFYCGGPRCDEPGEVVMTWEQLEDVVG